MLNEMTAFGARRYLKATAVRNLTVPILRALFENYVEYTQTVGPDSALSVCICELFPYAKINSIPDDACAFNNRGEWFNITILPSWNDRVDLDAYSREWVHKVVDQLAEMEKQDEKVPEGEEVVGTRGYFNGSMGDEKAALVYGEKLPKLRALKRKYDPELVFKKWFPIVPADA
jgi:hypothetical protein